MNPRTVLTLDELRRLPGDALLPASYLVAVAEEAVARARAQSAALPPADLDVAALAARIGRSRSRTRELVKLGEWGPLGSPGGPYLDRGRVYVPTAAVLAREERQRGAPAEGVQEPANRPALALHRPSRGRSGGSLVERQRRRAG